MLYSVAIMKRVPATETEDATDEVVYGPVNVASARCDDTSVIAQKLIAQAAAEGKLPGGWTRHHYVAGFSYQHFT